VENPVGAGWSYADDLSLLPTNNSQIADDLVTLFTAFLTAYPVFQTVPFFVFCESYGGKMTTTFATALLAAIDAGKVKSNFRGVALGDSWISGIDFTDTWGTVLRTSALMEANELAIMNANAVVPCQQAVAAGEWTTATNLWGTTENYVSQFSCVDFYDTRQVDCSAFTAEAFAAASPFGRMSPAALALAPEGIDHGILQSLYARHVARHLTYDQNTLMNVYIRQQLNALRPNTFPANVTWGSQSDAVFSTLSGDFMKPVIDEIDALLAGGRINVTIYEGNVDLICANVGAEQWMQKLTWPNMPAFWAANKTALSAFPGAPTGAFTKTFGTLSWWTVLQAGHMVPTDNGPMALAMLKNILNAQSL
jgi:serine carboxypeptidase 1